MEEVKTKSSKWIKTKGDAFKNFHWQRGYGAFSIGQSQVPTLKRYIASQRIHHKRVTFQDEYRKFLKTYGIDYDEDTFGIELSRAYSARKNHWWRGSSSGMPRFQRRRRKVQ